VAINVVARQTSSRGGADARRRRDDAAAGDDDDAEAKRRRITSHLERAETRGVDVTTQITMPMLPPPPRTGSRAPAPADDATAPADARDAPPTSSSTPAHAPPIGKTYDEPAWGGASEVEYAMDVVKAGAVVERARLDVDARGVKRSRVTFGRHPSCDVVVEHPSTSRLHAVVQFKANSSEAFVFDCGSAHGTFVNKRRVKPGVHVPVRVGDHIKLGESSRVYVIDGDESLMPEEGLSAEELRALAALEKAAEMEVERELAALKAERAAAAAAASGADESSWGMGDVDEAITDRQRAVEELHWRTYDGKLSEKQEKQRANIARKEEKIVNMRQEIDRIRAKESTQEGGLSAGQTTRLTQVASAIETLEEEIEDMDETLNESLRVTMGLSAVVSKRRRRRGSDDDDDNSGGDDDDDFYDRSGAGAQRKRRKDTHKTSNAKGGSGAPKTLETAATLWDKRLALETSIEETKELISVTEAAAQAERARTAGVSADGDALDAYMDEIGASKFTAQVDKLRIKLAEKVSELERISRLLRLADPTDEFKPGSVKGDAMRKRNEEERVKAEENAKRRAEELEAKRAEELEARKKRAEEDKRREEWERQGNVQEKRKFTGGAEEPREALDSRAKTKAPADEDDDGPVIVDDVSEHKSRERTIRSPSPDPPARASPPPVIADDEDDDDDGFLMPAQLAARGGLEIRKRPPPTTSSVAPQAHAQPPAPLTSTAEDTIMSDIQRLINASSGRRDDSDFDDETARSVAEWAPPPDQNGDGTSAANAKLGY